MLKSNTERVNTDALSKIPVESAGIDLGTGDSADAKGGANPVQPGPDDH